MEGVTYHFDNFDNFDRNVHTFRYGEKVVVKLKGVQEDTKIEITLFMNNAKPGDGKKLLCYAIRFLKEKGYLFESIMVDPDAAVGSFTDRFIAKSSQETLERYYAKYGFQKKSDGTMTASADTVIAHCKSGGRIRSTRRRLGGRLYRKRGSAYSRGTRR